MNEHLFEFKFSLITRHISYCQTTELGQTISTNNMNFWRTMPLVTVTVQQLYHFVREQALKVYKLRYILLPVPYRTLEPVLAGSCPLHSQQVFHKVVPLLPNHPLMFSSICLITPHRSSLETRESKQNIYKYTKLCDVQRSKAIQFQNSWKYLPTILNDPTALKLQNKFKERPKAS